MEQVYSRYRPGASMETDPGHHRKGEIQMRLLAIIAITGVLIFSVSAADLSGTWKGSMETQMGNTAVTITFQAGAALAGKVKVDEYEAPIEKAKLDGDKIHFEMTIEHGTLTYDGT